MELDNDIEIKEESEEEEEIKIKSEPEDSDDEEKKEEIIKKNSKPGIIYLSTIPPGMKVKDIREYFSKFGEVKRSFLQPEENPKKYNRKNQVFIEGWIEFRKRKHAKKVASLLNNTAVGGKKKKIYYDFLWNIKYLHGFQWVHLNERLAYERISKQQKLRNEISAAKKETNFFAKSVDMNIKKKKKGAISQDEEMERMILDEAKSTIGSNQPDESTKFIEKQVTSEDPPAQNGNRVAFLKSIFGNK